MTPEGAPDPSVFSTEYNREGIRTGIAIALMVQTGFQNSQPTTYFRHFWGASKRQEVLASLQTEDFNQQYGITNPSPENRFSFRPSQVGAHYLGLGKNNRFLCHAA